MAVKSQVAFGYMDNTGICEDTYLFDGYAYIKYSRIKPVVIKPSQCLHDNCYSCGGTGIRKDGLGSCIHMLSCSCSKCSPR